MEEKLRMLRKWLDGSPITQWETGKMNIGMELVNNRGILR